MNIEEYSYPIEKKSNQDKNLKITIHLNDRYVKHREVGIYHWRRVALLDGFSLGEAKISEEIINEEENSFTFHMASDHSLQLLNILFRMINNLFYKKIEYVLHYSQGDFTFTGDPFEPKTTVSKVIIEDSKEW